MLLKLTLIFVRLKLFRDFLNEDLVYLELLRV
jgi:hypothetical protein